MEFRLMRAFLPFLRLSLTRPALPYLLAQDAAGGGEGAGDCGAFVLAIGCPSLDLLQQTWA